MKESELLKEIMLRLGSKPYLKVWRNNTGQAWQGKRHSLKPGSRVIDNMGRTLITQSGDILLEAAHVVNFGLLGSGDIAGIIAPLGRTVYIETKAGKYKQTEQQKRFEAMIKNMGGIYIVARDAETAETEILKEIRLKNDRD